MGKAYIVLEENLLDLFFDFYFNENKFCANDKLKLLELLKPFLITKEQFMHCYKKLDSFKSNTNQGTLLIAQLQKLFARNSYWTLVSQKDYTQLPSVNPFSDEIMQKLIEQSIYKVLLVKQNSLNPIAKEVNITSSNIQFPYIEKLYKNNKTGRENAQKHFKELIKNANEIIIKDNFCKDYLTKIKELFQHNPNCKITFYAERDAKEDIKSIFPTATIKIYDKDNMHDRYLCIDNKIEIILTSGFKYLFEERKELTYIITEK